MLHSRGSGSRWRMYYTVWTADDRCKSFNKRGHETNRF